MIGVTNAISPPDVGPNPPGLDAAVSRALDPNATPDEPKDPLQDDAKLLERFQKNARRCADRRVSFERVWWRLLLYLLGRQWIYFERAVGNWVDKRLQKWIPRPVTNKILETLDTILSVFQSVELAVAVRPEGATPSDITAAETASKYEAPLRTDHQWSRVQREADWWLGALGNTFLHVWWDYSGDSATAFVSYEQCAACKVTSSPVAVQKAGHMCPACGSPILNPATDQNGQPVGETLRKGHGCTDACSPLEIAYPLAFSDPNDSDVIIRRRWRTKEYYESRLTPEQMAKIQWETVASERSLQLLRSLAATNEVSSLPNSSISGEPTEQEGVTESEMWEKPSKDFPQGLVLRVVNTVGGDGASGMVLRLPEEGLPGPLPYKTADGRFLWTWLHTGYVKFGGRGWARSPLESLIEKQNQLNQIDSLIQLIVQRTANPVWLEPKGSEVTKFSGEPGLVVKYNPIAAGGNAKPERIPGEQVPSSLVSIREMILADIEQLAGTYDIMKGAKPAGVEAFSAMQLLVERSQSRYGTVLEARGATYRNWFKIALEMERQLGPDERATAIMGPNGAWQRSVFQKASLDGSIRIEVEDGSQMPKTSLGTRAAIQQLQGLGVIDAKNPETGYRILQVFGRTDLYPGLDAQVTGARREQEAFEQWAATVQFAPPTQAPMQGPTGAMITDPTTGQPVMRQVPPQPNAPPPGQLQAWHDSNVHLAEHLKWANGDSMQTLMTQKPAIMPFVTNMITQHQQHLAQTQPPQPVKVQYQFKGEDLADPQVREVFDRTEQVMSAPPAPASMRGPAPNGNGQPADRRAVGRDGHGVGAGRALHNSNQESGNVSDVTAPPSGHETQ
jgi:hypothetical protein